MWTFISDLPPIPHNFGWPNILSLRMELLIKPPFHIIQVLFANTNIVAEHGLSLQGNPPFYTHFVSFWFLYPYHTHSYEFHPHFVSTRFHTLHNFSIFDPQFHTKFFSSMLLHINFWLSRSPGSAAYSSTSLENLCQNLDHDWHEKQRSNLCGPRRLSLLNFTPLKITTI